MVCNGPELPDHNPQEITAPQRMEADDLEPEDSDDEREHFGYSLLPQDPDGMIYDNDPDSEDERIFERILQAHPEPPTSINGSDSDSHVLNQVQDLPEAHSTAIDGEEESFEAPSNSNITLVPDNVPPIEPMASVLTREVWNAPRPHDTIEMTADRADQIRRMMANFTLPINSEPQWGMDLSNQMLQQWITNRLGRTTNKNN